MELFERPRRIAPCRSSVKRSRLSRALFGLIPHSLFTGLEASFLSLIEAGMRKPFQFKPQLKDDGFPWVVSSKDGSVLRAILSLWKCGDIRMNQSNNALIIAASGIGHYMRHMF